MCQQYTFNAISSENQNCIFMFNMVLHLKKLKTPLINNIKYN